MEYFVVKSWGVSMIGSFFLCVLTCVFSTFFYFLVLYDISENSFKMLFSKDEYDIIDHEYIPAHTTDNTKKAAVMCRDYKDTAHKRLHYAGYKDCRLFKATYETEFYCKDSCSGFGNCVFVCPQNAIRIENGIAVISTYCNGCGLCVDACPQNLIQLVSVHEDHWVDCIAPNCYEVHEKMKPINLEKGVIDPMQKKIEYSERKYFKI